jgi:hypothetical protein
LKIYYDESGRDPWVENADAVLLLDKDDDD